MHLAYNRFTTPNSDGVVVLIGGVNDGTVKEIDLTAYYNRRDINQVGSIRVFAQYQALILRDRDTNIKYYFPAGACTNIIANTHSKRFGLFIIPTLQTAALDIEVVFYEQAMSQISYYMPLP